MNGRKRIKQLIAFLMTTTTQAPRDIQQSEPADMEDISDVIKDDPLFAASSWPSGNPFGSPQPFRSFQPSQSSQTLQETVQRPREQYTGRKFIYFDEDAAPGPSTNRISCASASPRPDNVPYRVIIEEPINPRKELNEVVMPSSNRMGAGARGAPQRVSCEPYVKIIEQPINSRSEDVAPSSSRGAGARGTPRHVSCEPYVTIIEQPINHRRFRYDSELESAGAIRGVNSTTGRKSYPKIKIWNYVGFAIITVSLVTKNETHRAHPNGIVGKVKNCFQGRKKKTSKQKEENNAYNFNSIYVKKVYVTKENCVFEFDHLGIRIVKPKQIMDELNTREALKVDPYNMGFEHKHNPKSIDLHAVRLCFQVKLVPQNHTLPPVVSDVIRDVKIVGELEIKKRCECSGVDTGGPEIMFLCKQVNPNDVEVVFFEEIDGHEVWKELGTNMMVHSRVAITCVVPAYTRKPIEYDTQVNVWVQLRRPSDDTRGNREPFTYKLNSLDSTVERKRRKMIHPVVQQYVDEHWTPPAVLPPDNSSQYDQNWRNMPGSFDINPVVSGPSYVNPAAAGPSYINPDVQRPW